MKHGKRLTLQEKKYLLKQGLEPKNYLLERKDADSYTFFNIKTGKLEGPMRR